MSWRWDSRSGLAKTCTYRCVYSDRAQKTLPGKYSSAQLKQNFNTRSAQLSLSRTLTLAQLSSAQLKQNFNTGSAQLSLNRTLTLAQLRFPISKKSQGKGGFFSQENQGNLTKIAEHAPQKVEKWQNVMESFFLADCSAEYVKL